jgi:SAM-dependent methyltransferase
MLNRRRFLTGSALIAPLAFPLDALAEVLKDVAPRGRIGRLKRLPTLDVESGQAFYTSYRVWVNGDLARAAQARAAAVMAANGIAQTDDVPMAEVLRLLEGDPIMWTHTHAWERSQSLMWNAIRDAYHADADLYLSEMEAADKTGPGTLEFDRRLVIPDYTKHEIHLQPGGYVGDPFAGHIYLHGQNVVFTGGNFQDKAQLNLAAAVPLPADRKVRRIHEPGCSIGQLTQALKERFPEAEVWGTDVAAPMIRFGHLRSAQMGVDVNYAQRLAEDNKFPDGYFDVVVDNLLLHEITADAARRMFQENFRTLRPGGIYYPLDLHTGSPKPRTAYQKYNAWRDYRWNHEPWRFEYASLDLPAELRKVGFVVTEGPPGRRGDAYNVLATKPA